MNNTKNTNYTEEKNVIGENCFKRLQKMVGDAAEVTKLSTNIIKKDNVCSAQKETKKIEKKLDPYHIDHIQMSALDNVVQSYTESNEEN